MIIVSFWKNCNEKKQSDNLYYNEDVCQNMIYIDNLKL